MTHLYGVERQSITDASTALVWYFNCACVVHNNRD